MKKNDEPLFPAHTATLMRDLHRRAREGRRMILRPAHVTWIADALDLYHSGVLGNSRQGRRFQKRYARAVRRNMAKALKQAKKAQR